MKHANTMMKAMDDDASRRCEFRKMEEARQVVEILKRSPR